MEKANDDDKKETPSVTYSKAELEKAVSIVNAEVQRLTCQIKQFLEEEDKETIIIRGYTSKNFLAEIWIEPSTVADIILDDYFMMNYMLKSEIPGYVWTKIAERVGLCGIEDIEFSFPLGPDGAKNFYVAPNEN